MSASFECEFEAEVLADVLQLRWPDAVGAHLREHVLGCPICSEVVAIAAAFDGAKEEVVLPDSGRVWWMAQIRTRREAAETATRPILAAQIAAFAWALGLLAVCLGTAFTWFVTDVDVKSLVSSAATLLGQHGAFIIGTAALVFVLPAAAYFAMGKE